MLDLSIRKKIGNESIDISLKHENGILAIMGASGAGKTTLLNIIVGIQTPDSGYINLDNKTLFNKSTNTSLKIQSRNIGYVFQELLLFPNMTLYENIRFSQESRANIDEDFIDELLKLMKIQSLRDKYPNQVSGGEKQRCALARSLSSKPRLVLVDEGFSALDSKTKFDIMENFKNIINSIGAIAIVVTHSLEDAEFLADDYFILKENI